MVSPIAEPIGLFRAGPSGAGGQLEPMPRIRRDIFQRVNMVYGLDVKADGVPPGPKTMIIDIQYDDFKAIPDPHAARPMQFVADYPENPTVGYWYGTFQAPNYKKFSRVGKHKVTIKVAPRRPPAAGTTGATDVLPSRDFSPEAGGVIQTFEFEIYPDNEPVMDMSLLDE